jgi:hypothetical protein
MMMKTKESLEEKMMMVMRDRSIGMMKTMKLSKLSSNKSSSHQNNNSPLRSKKKAKNHKKSKNLKKNQHPLNSPPLYRSNLQ